MSGFPSNPVAIALNILVVLRDDGPHVILRVQSLALVCPCAHTTFERADHSFCHSVSWDSATMFINRSETSAARKLLQCKGFGVYENDVSFKFEKDPDDVPDMTREDFEARKKVVDAVARWVNANNPKNGGKELVYNNEWVPILYSYEARLGRLGHDLGLPSCLYYSLYRHPQSGMYVFRLRQLVPSPYDRTSSKIGAT